MRPKLVVWLGYAHTEEKGREAGRVSTRYLDEALELRVLLQESRLLLLEREDVFCRLLENGCLRAGGKELHGWSPPPRERDASSKKPSLLLPTLLSFSPSVWGMRVLRDWKPALMLCMRLRSLLLAISRRIRLSWSRWVSGVRGMLARLPGRTGVDSGLMSSEVYPQRALNITCVTSLRQTVPEGLWQVTSTMT